MNTFRRLSCIAIASMAIFMSVGCTGRQPEIKKALIVSGQNNHNWEVSHKVLKQILDNSGMFETDLALTAPTGGDMSGFCPDFSAYDVVVLDIFMGGLTGVEVAKEIRRTDTDVKLVFCSHSNEFATESYEVNAQYYLLKPATQGSIVNMLQRLNLDLIQRKQFVTLPDGHDLILRDILYTEYYNHVVTVYLKNKDTYRIRTNHATIEELLASCGFIHSPCKGMLVNFYEIAAEMSAKKISFSEKARKDIGAMCDKVTQMLILAKDAFDNLNRAELPDLAALENEVDTMKKELTTSHFARLAEGDCSMDVSPY